MLLPLEGLALCEKKTNEGEEAKKNQEGITPGLRGVVNHQVGKSKEESPGETEAFVPPPPQEEGRSRGQTSGDAGGGPDEPTGRIHRHEGKNPGVEGMIIVDFLMEEYVRQTLNLPSKKNGPDLIQPQIPTGAS